MSKFFLSFMNFCLLFAIVISELFLLFLVLGFY